MLPRHLSRMLPVFGFESSTTPASFGCDTAAAISHGTLHHYLLCAVGLGGHSRCSVAICSILSLQFSWILSLLSGKCWNWLHQSPTFFHLGLGAPSWLSPVTLASSRSVIEQSFVQLATAVVVLHSSKAFFALGGRTHLKTLYIFQSTKFLAPSAIASFAFLVVSLVVISRSACDFAYTLNCILSSPDDVHF